MKKALSEKITIVTHNGSFHADDVFSVAALTLLFNGRKQSFDVVRSRDPKVAESGDIVLDVGGVYDESNLRFDHHQIGGAGARPNGIPFAAFGLIWKKFGEEISGDKKVAEWLDKKLVQYIDAGDNGAGELKPYAADVFPYTIEQSVCIFNLGWTDETKDGDSRFFEAVNFAAGVLEREIKTTKELVEGEKFVVQAYASASDKRLIILDKNYPWQEVLNRYSEPLYVVEPANSGWHAEAVRDNPTSFVNRKNFPAAWAGRRDAELAAITGISDAVFCPNACFVVFAKSKEGAIALAKMAIGL